MTHYTSHWDCWICGEFQDTIDNPKTAVCHKCIRPLARTLCKQALNVELTTVGVDQAYWEQKAWDYAAVLFRRRPSNIRRAA